MSRREAVAAVAHLGLTSDLMVFWTGTTVRGGERCVGGGGGDLHADVCASPGACRLGWTVPQPCLDC